MKSSKTRPLARTENLVVETVGDESVVYDSETSIAHALKPLAAAAFMYADGTNTAAEIAELATYRLGTTVTEAEATGALAELEQLSLLDTPRQPGVSRRDAIKLFAAAGAGTVLVTSVAAPAAFAGTSGNGYPYLCGQNANAITGNTGYGYPSVSFPQFNSSVGSVGGPVSSASKYYLSGSCVAATGTATCTYNGHTISGASQSECTSSGFCVNSSSYAYSSKGKSSCKNGYTWITGATYSSGATTGTYQCVPCDGLISKSGNKVSGYQCCEVVCVPGSGTVSGAITSSADPICTSSSGCAGYGPYTTAAYKSEGYPNKYCTTNSKCNPGDCS